MAAPQQLQPSPSIAKACPYCKRGFGDLLEKYASDEQKGLVSGGHQVRIDEVYKDLLLDHRCEEKLASFKVLMERIMEKLRQTFLEEPTNMREMTEQKLQEENKDA